MAEDSGRAFANLSEMRMRPSPMMSPEQARAYRTIMLNSSLKPSNSPVTANLQGAYSSGPRGSQLMVDPSMSANLGDALTVGGGYRTGPMGGAHGRAEIKLPAGLRALLEGSKSGQRTAVSAPVAGGEMSATLSRMSGQGGMPAQMQGRVGYRTPFANGGGADANGLPSEQDESLIDMATRYGQGVMRKHPIITRGLTTMATDPLDLLQWLATHGVDPEIAAKMTREEMQDYQKAASSIPNASELANKYLTQAGVRESETLPEQIGELGVSMLGPAMLAKAPTLLAKAPKAFSWGKKILGKADKAEMREMPRMADGGKPKFANGGEANAEKITLKNPTLNTRFREKGYVSPNDPLGEKRWDPYDNNASNVPIKSYKVDYKTGELETLPTTFNQYGAFAYGQNEAEEHSRQMQQKYPSSRSNELLDMAGRLRALHASQKFGGPKVSPEDMVALLNQEGRSDFGGPLPYKYEHDKKAVKLAKKLEEEGFFPTDTYLAASLLSAQNTAKRLKIPWQKVWNGTGSVPVWGNKGETAVFKGTTYDKAHMHGGLDYVNEFELNKKAALDPKNADLLSFVQKNMSDPPDIDALNQQEYEVREKDRQEFIKAKLQQNSQYNDSNRYGLTLYGPKDLATHAYNAATEGRNPFYWTDQDIEAREIKDLDKWYPKVVPPIKIGNRGTFDPTETDITKSHGGPVHMGKGGLLKAGAEELVELAAKYLPKAENAVKEAEDYFIPAQSIKSHSMPKYDSTIKREGKNIENVPISWLSKLPGNAFRHSDEKINEMSKNIAENGLSEPLIINVGKNSRTAKLGEGNHRLEALKRAGFTHAPVKVDVGREWGSELGERANYDVDLIPKVDEYFSSNAKPSEVFKSLKGITKSHGGPIRKASGGLSRVNEAGNYTKPGMRKQLFNSIKARAVQGTGAGQWSARKAQLLAKSYKEKGGGYKD